MAKRILSTFLLWSVVIGALWGLRTNGAVLMVGVVAALTLRELYALLGAAGYAPFAGMGMVFGTAVAVGPWTEAHWGWRTDALPALAALLGCVRILGERPPEKRVEALMSTVFGIVYIGTLLQYLVRIATPPSLAAAAAQAASSGRVAPLLLSADARLILCIWVIAVAKFCDVGALLSGLAFGRHKLAPQISPKKTWEGVLGGVLVSMAIGALVFRLGRGTLPDSMTPLRGALLAAPVGALGVVSDLVESVIKRRANLKDSGGAIPGIGGMFDLSDSILLAAPAAYFLLRLP